MSKLFLLLVLAGNVSAQLFPFPGLATGGAAPGPAVVGNGFADSNIMASATQAVSVTVTAGNALGVFVGTDYGGTSCAGGHTWTITGGGNAYTQIGTFFSYGMCVAVFRAFSISGGTYNVLATIDTGTPTGWYLAALELSGVTAEDAGVTGATGQATGTSVTSSAFSTAVAAEIIIVAGAVEAVNDPITSGTIGGVAATVASGTALTGSSNYGGGLAYVITTATQTSITGSVSKGAGSQNIALMVVAFR